MSQYKGNSPSLNPQNYNNPQISKQQQQLNIDNQKKDKQLDGMINSFKSRNPYQMLWGKGLGENALEYSITIINVPDVAQAMKFYENAFGFKSKFIDKMSAYGEVESGPVSIGFVNENMAGYSFTKTRPTSLPPAVSLFFVSDDVNQDYQKAIQNGAKVVQPPHSTVWTEKVAIVSDLNGVAIHISAPHKQEYLQQNMK